MSPSRVLPLLLLPLMMMMMKMMMMKMMMMIKMSMVMVMTMVTMMVTTATMVMTIMTTTAVTVTMTTMTMTTTEMMMMVMMMMTLMMMVVVMVMTLGDRCCRACKERVGREEPAVGRRRGGHPRPPPLPHSARAGPGHQRRFGQDLLFPNKPHIGPLAWCHKLSLVSAWHGRAVVPAPALPWARGAPMPTPARCGLSRALCTVT